MKTYIPIYTLATSVLLAITMWLGSTTLAHAQVSQETQNAIDSLSVALFVLSEQIKSSPDISDQERLVLYTQLIEISRAILQVRGVAVAEQLKGLLDTDKTDQGQALADIGLYRVVVQLDLDQATAAVQLLYPKRKTDEGDIEALLKTEYTQELQTLTLDATPISVARSFTNKMKVAKEQVVASIATELNLNKLELAGATYVSARNPVRDVDKRTDEEVGELLRNFGRYSMIERVMVSPSDTKAEITVSSDQDETILFEMVRSDAFLEYDQKRKIKKEDLRYSFTAEFYLATGDWVTLRDTDSDGAPKPLLTQKKDDLTAAELLVEVNKLFAEIPFVAGLKNADQALLDFLLDNRAYYRAASSDSSPVAANTCISRTDELVVDEYIIQILYGLRAQHIVSPDLVQYRLPVMRDSDIKRTESRCLGVERFF